MRRSVFQSGGREAHQKGHFLEKGGTYKGKSQSENIHFLDIGIYPTLHCNNIIRDDFNVCFSLYMVQDTSMILLQLG